jgi:hypothetical protein
MPAQRLLRYGTSSLATMPDPLGIAASIIAVVQLTASVIEYLQAVHDAGKDRIGFLSEISGLHHLFTCASKSR